ncbi:MAG: hypothetical protein M3362_03180 [Acidobacteriota bacterium]|nr:hypothetical protein [Acidobacteriota bacterium]
MIELIKAIFARSIIITRELPMTSDESADNTKQPTANVWSELSPAKRVQATNIIARMIYKYVLALRSENDQKKTTAESPEPTDKQIRD